MYRDRCRTLLILLGLLTAHSCHGPSESTSGIPEALTASPEQKLARGAWLYAGHCSVCHGTLGRGDGPAAPHLFPPARRFDTARFRLVSSQNGAPYDRDLVATLRRGIPGSAMPAWSWLPEEDLWALAAHVRALALEGLESELAAFARSADDPLLLTGAPRIARARLTPDRALAAPASVSGDAAAVQKGRELFLQHCAQCHATDGTGEPEPRPDEDATLNWARDFTAGFLKGGDSPRELACRIRAGMPGTAMPPTTLEPADEAALIAFLRDLIPEGTAERLVHTRATLRARHIAELPETPEGPAWDAAHEIDLVLAPLWWNDAAVLEASLAALHDGKRLALRLSWPDATGDVRLFADTTASDAAALQLSTAEHPALFGMGSPHEPTNLWHWQALRVEDVSGALDLLDPTPHAAQPTRPGEVRADVPLYQRLLSQIDPSDRVDSVIARGVASVPRASRVAGDVQASARWRDGRWALVFLRSLEPEAGDQVALAPGASLQLACAVWNGAAGDRGARKSISIWQEVLLDP